MRTSLKLLATLAVALVVSGLSVQAVQAQPLEARLYPSVKKINSTTCSVKIKVVAEVAGMGKATFQSASFTVKKYQPPRMPPVKYIAIFRFSSSMQWVGNKIVCKTTVTAGFLGKSLTLSRTESVLVYG